MPPGGHDQTLETFFKSHGPIIAIWVIRALLYPFDYAKCLMQLGHEPVPPYETTTLFGFGPRAMIRPNIIKYLNFIRKTDGLLECYRGYSAKMISDMTLFYLLNSIHTEVNVHYGTDVIANEEHIFGDEAPRPDVYKKTAYVKMCTTAIGVFITYPWYVVSLRMIAAYIGKEEQYSSLPRAIVSVYKDSGIFGFYSGFVPFLLYHLSGIALFYTFLYYLNKYLVKIGKWRVLSSWFAEGAAFSFVYPLDLAATCMAVNGSSLQAGNPPNMPLYSSWITCLLSLFKEDMLTRGGSTFFRYIV